MIFSKFYRDVQWVPLSTLRTFPSSQKGAGYSFLGQSWAIPKPLAISVDIPFVVTSREWSYKYTLLCVTFFFVVQSVLLLVSPKVGVSDFVTHYLVEVIGQFHRNCAAMDMLSHM